MRKLIATAIIVAFGTLSQASHARQTIQAPQPSPDDPCGHTPNGGVIYCYLGRDGKVLTTSIPDSSSPGTSRPNTTPVSSVESSTKYVPYNRLTTDSNGDACVTTGFVPEGVYPTDPAPDNRYVPGAGGYNNVFTEYPPCPGRSPGTAEPAPVETRAMIAARHWERVALPKPEPFIAPGRAITGKTAYLETRGETIHTYTTNTIFGPLRIVAKGSYTINWGDGTTTGPYDLEGKPWPDGQITHEYIDIGSYDIVVTEKWTADWSFADESGTLRTLQTEGRIDDFPVEQIQAVIGR